VHSKETAHAFLDAPKNPNQSFANLFPQRLSARRMTHNNSRFIMQRVQPGGSWVNCNFADNSVMSRTSHFPGVSVQLTATAIFVAFVFAISSATAAPSSSNSNSRTYQATTELELYMLHDHLYARVVITNSSNDDVQIPSATELCYGYHCIKDGVGWGGGGNFETSDSELKEVLKPKQTSRRRLNLGPIKNWDSGSYSFVTHFKTDDLRDGRFDLDITADHTISLKGTD
jgi:hypothetical protein